MKCKHCQGETEFRCDVCNVPICETCAIDHGEPDGKPCDRRRGLEVAR